MILIVGTAKEAPMILETPILGLPNIPSPLQKDSQREPLIFASLGIIKMVAEAS